MELTSNRRLARLTSRTISLGLGRLRSRGMKSRRLRACIAQVRCQCRTNRSWPVPAPEGPGVQSSARHSHETGRGRLSTWAVNAAVAVAEVPLGSRPNCFNSRPRDPSVLALVSLPPAATFMPQHQHSLCRRRPDDIPGPSDRTQSLSGMASFHLQEQKPPTPSFPSALTRHQRSAALAHETLPSH